MAIPLSGKLLDLKCTEHSFPEFPELLFGTTNDESATYFDASLYLQEKGLTQLPLAHFLIYWEYPIRAIISAYDLDEKKICVKNTEGHILIDSRLIYIFISFINPDFFAFMCERMDEMFSDGFCVSDTYLLQTTKRRIPPEVIIENLNAED